MPIEIKELHIKVAVTPPPSGQMAGIPMAAPGTTPGGAEAQEALVAECVEQVLQILQHKMER